MQNIDNDRPDIQLAYWKSQGEAVENKWAKLNTSIPDYYFAESPLEKGVQKISEIVRNLIKKNGGLYCGIKELIYLDIDWENLESEMCCQAITPEGWSHPLVDSDNLIISWQDCGAGLIDIRVELFDPEEEEEV